MMTTFDSTDLIGDRNLLLLLSLLRIRIQGNNGDSLPAIYRQSMQSPQQP